MAKKWTCIRCCCDRFEPHRTCTVIVTLTENGPTGCLYPETANLPAEWMVD